MSLILLQKDPATVTTQASHTTLGVDLGGVPFAKQPSGETVSLGVAVQAASPTSGATVSFADSPVNTVLYLTPAATLATLTVNLPSDAESSLGQIVRLVSSQEITSLTVAGAANIYIAPVSLDPYVIYLFVKIAADTWVVSPS